MRAAGRTRTLPPAGREALGVRPSPGAAGHLSRLISDVSPGAASARTDVSRFSDIAAPGVLADSQGRTPGQCAGAPRAPGLQEAWLATETL